MPLRTVVHVGERPQGGYAVTHEATGAWLRRARHTDTADHVVFAGGTWGTQKLLHTLRDNGALPRLSRDCPHYVQGVDIHSPSLS